MSDEVVGDVCELLEVIETEQVVEILDDTQFLDLVAPMETRGEMPGGGCSDFCEVPAEERQLAGQKRKRIEVMGDLEEAGVFGVSLPTAVVPPSPRLVLATPLLPPPKPHSSTPHQTSENTTTHHLQNTDPANPSPLLPAVNIQLTSEELQALFGILQQRGSTQNPCSSSSTTVFSSSTSSQAQTHHQHYQPVAPKKMVTAVVIPSSASSSATSTTSSVSLSSTGIMEAQAVAAAKASVTGKKRQCNCKNSQCLKLYCDCFSHEEWCSIDCSCRNCRNNPAFSQLRELTLKVYKERDPTAFQHREARPARGCKCRKTLCIKKYCECFHSGVHCSSLCRCINCKNTDASSSSSSPLAPSQTATHPISTHPSHTEHHIASPLANVTRLDCGTYLSSSTLSDTTSVYKDLSTSQNES